MEMLRRSLFVRSAEPDQGRPRDSLQESLSLDLRIDFEISPQSS
jgi:hypothetical protein